MINLSEHASGRHFLQIPGPSPVPDRVLAAIRQQTIDHRGPAFARLGKKVLTDAQKVFQTQEHVFIYSGSGTGAWEAALVNTLNIGDQVLMYETGHFASLWSKLAVKLGFKPTLLNHDQSIESWRKGVDAAQIEAALRQDTTHAIKAVCVVHNETSTGVTSNIAAVRRAIDAVGHPALLMVDTISGLGCMDYQHQAWGVDVSISGSQKGLMLPPGLGFNAVSQKALAAHRASTYPRSYWDWSDMLGPNRDGYWPTTPSTNLLYGLDVACDLLLTEGLSNVFARHARWGNACRAAVNAWGLPILCTDSTVYSNVLTAVLTPEGHDADAIRSTALGQSDVSLGTGLGRLKGRVFRIGHLGDCNDLTLLGTLAGVQMAIQTHGIALKADGVTAAMNWLNQHRDEVVS